jgi:hypothetical protein
MNRVMELDSIALPLTRLTMFWASDCVYLAMIAQSITLAGEVRDRLLGEQLGLTDLSVCILEKPKHNFAR